MGKGNGKTEVKNLDLEHELPAAEAGEENPASSAKVVDISVGSEVEKLKAERDALLDRLARQQAEFDNARKRAAREQAEFRDFAAAEVIKVLLPALDSFERALKLSGAPSGSSDGGEFRNGVELIYRQLLDALQKAGVVPINALGAEFDPKLHEAIEMVDSAEVPDHHVLDELQRGYKYKDRLLRPAMVRVARNPGK
ncbi:MAG TPA: nucleotide exchange factor GrpE [Terriglobales bacterium]|nr:nucleotide exchange factor GrpE [Terriglobales bacterium]